jgi:hypothetical protein
MIACDWLRILVPWLPRSVMRIVAMLCTINAVAARRFRSIRAHTGAVKRTILHVPAMELIATSRVGRQNPIGDVLSGDPSHIHRCAEGKPVACLPQ